MQKTIAEIEPPNQTFAVWQLRLQVVVLALADWYDVTDIGAAASRPSIFRAASCHIQGDAVQGKTRFTEKEISFI